MEDLARLAVSVVLYDKTALRSFAREKGDRATRDLRVHETLRQGHVFCGFPRAIAAFDVLSDAGLKLVPDDDVQSDPAEPAARGAVLFDQIYADKSDDIRKHLAQLDPVFADWVAEHAYGRVLTRPGLEARERELLAVAVLAALGHDRQLASHARGAVRCGASPKEVAAILEAAADLIPEDRTVRARDIIERFASTPEPPPSSAPDSRPRPQ